MEIDASLLKFDTAESQALLVDQCGLDLTTANVAELEESTDGWAAALQLASLSLRDHADPAALIETFVRAGQSSRRVFGVERPGQPRTGPTRFPAVDLHHQTDLQRGWPPRSPITRGVEVSSKRSKNVISFYGGPTPRDRGSNTITFSPSTFCTASSATQKIGYQNYTAGPQRGIWNTRCSARPSIT